MASDVDICNLSLAHLGEDGAISSLDPPEGSAQASHCARFYPMARDVLLELFNWRFATKRAGPLAELTAAAPEGWAYVYAPPATALRIIKLLPEGAADDHTGVDYVQEALDNGTLVIYSNEPLAHVKYVARITDTLKFTPLFVSALSRLLASYLAGPVLKGETGRSEAQGQLKLMMALDLPTAKAADANARQYKPTHTPSWMQR